MSLSKKLFFVNGVQRLFVYETEKEKLSETLRRFGLTGCKVGCGTGQCGACTVILNGELVRSCIMPTRKVPENSVIETIEGLGTASHLHPIQAAWIEAGAVQCGFCTPAFILSTKVLLEKNPSPTRQEVRKWFHDHKNYCRCTGYKQIVDAVMLAAEVLRGEKTLDDSLYHKADDGRIYGGRVQGPSAVAKVLGAADYGADVSLKMPEETLYAALAFPQVNHALVKEIDISEAEKMPGVVEVLTAKDVPGDNNTSIPFFHKRAFRKRYAKPLLVDQKIYHMGDPIAMVVARTQKEARNAAAKVRLSYEQLPEYKNALEALQPDAISIHEDSPNDCCHQPLFKGEEVDPIIENAAYSVSGSFYSVREPHLALEPWAVQAFIDEDGVMVVQCKGQALANIRAGVAGVLGWDKEKVRIIETTTGASFGWAMTAEAAGLVALAAYATGKPVRMDLNYSENQRLIGKRSSSFSNATFACDENGKLSAIKYDIVIDIGAHTRYAPILLGKVCRFVGYPYDVPNIRGLSRTVFSNNSYCTAYRGLGSQQPFTMAEQMMDMLAEKAGIDPFEFRYINAAREGATTPNSYPYRPYSVTQLMDKLRPYYQEALKWKEEGVSGGVKRGVGVSLGGYNTSSESDIAQVALELNPDGTVTNYNTWEDQGQGAEAGAILHTCEALKDLGITPDQVHVYMNDTSLCPDTGMAAGSRSHYMAGLAIIDAAKQLLDAMRKEDGSYRSYSEMVSEGIPVKYIGTCSTKDRHIAPIDPNTGKGEGKAETMYIGYVTCVEVDPETGKVDVKRVRSVADVGVVGNRATLEGQALGGLSHCLGFALKEEYSHYDKKCATMLGCGLLNIEEHPDDVKFDFLETYRERGPFGSSGASETFQSCGHISVINAIYNATGVRVYELPATPDKIREGLRLKAEGKDNKPGPYHLGMDIDIALAEIKANPV